MDNLDSSKQQEAPNKDNPQELTPEQLKRYKEQIEWSKQEWKRLREMIINMWVQEATKDASSLLELHKQDPKIAEEVAKQFGYSDYKEAENTILSMESSNDSTPQKQESEEDKFKRWYSEMKKTEEHQTSLEEANKIFSSLPEEQQEKARKYFDMISEWKTLTKDKATEFAKMATLYVNKDKIKEDKFSLDITKLASNWLGQSSNTKGNTDVKSKDFANTWAKWKFSYLYSNNK